MATFDFITNEEFRASLESDYRELSACMKATAWKAVHVLAGSIIEAVLIDYLLATDYQKRKSSDPLKMDLAQIISACEQDGILSQKAAELSSVIKSYRNLIHPGRMVRLRETVDENGAKIAQTLVEIIVEEISARRREKYGYTAEQIVSKLERDPSAIAIIGHLLKTTGQFEIERLLLKVLPQRYFELIAAEAPATDILAIFEKCFRSAFENATEDRKKKVVTKFVSILKEEDQRTVLTYETAFFIATDLQYLPAEDSALVKEHLISRLQKGINSQLLGAMNGIGPFLTVDDISGFTDACVRAILGATPDTLRGSTREFLQGEYLFMLPSVQERVKKRLEDWIPFLQEKEWNELAQTVKDLMALLEPIPSDKQISQ